MFDWRRKNGIHDASKSSRCVVLAITQRLWASGKLIHRDALLGGILGLESAASVMKAAELNGYAGSDAYQWRECAFVEGCCPFVLEDLRSAV